MSTSDSASIDSAATRVTPAPLMNSANQDQVLEILQTDLADWKEKKIQEETLVIRSRLIELEKRKLAREQKAAERQNYFLRHQKPVEPLYKKMEREYTEKQVLPEIQRRDEKMQEQHERMRRVPISEIQQHAMYTDFDAKYKVVERSPTKSPRPSPNKNTSPTYRGRFHEERRIEEMKNRIDEITKEQQKLELKVKREEYGERVRDYFTPRIDPKKVAEMEERKEKLRYPKHPPARKELKQSPRIDQQLTKSVSPEKEKQSGSKWSEPERQEKYALRKKTRPEACAESIEEPSATGSSNDYDEDYTVLERMECKRLSGAYFELFMSQAAAAKHHERHESNI